MVTVQITGGTCAVIITNAALLPACSRTGAVTGLNILRKSRNPTYMCLWWQLMQDSHVCFPTLLLFFFGKYLMYYTMSLNNSHLFPTDIRKIRWKILSTLSVLRHVVIKNLYKEGASSFLSTECVSNRQWIAHQAIRIVRDCDEPAHQPGISRALTPADIQLHG